MPDLIYCISLFIPKNWKCQVKKNRIADFSKWMKGSIKNFNGTYTAEPFIGQSLTQVHAAILIKLTEIGIAQILDEPDRFTG